MSLTPVRIKGKARRATATTPGVKRPRGRPLSATQTPASSATSTRSNTPASESSMAAGTKRASDAQGRYTGARKRQKRSKAPLSQLEQLPAEILQNIFWESMNVELPLASRVLNKKLSSEHVQMELTMRAVYRGPDAEDLCAEDEKDDHPLVPIQTKLLQRRFFTWDFFKKFKNLAKQRHFAECANSAYEIDRLEREETWNDSTQDHNYYTDDFFTQYPLVYCRFRSKANIPEKLLNGPYDDGKTRFLSLLVWQRLGIDLDNSTSLETLIDGIFHAIRTQNLIILWHLFNVKGTTGEDIPATTEMVRCAILEPAQSEDIDGRIVALLLECSCIGEMNYDDPLLWKWAESERKNEGAKWLIEVLKSVKRESRQPRRSRIPSLNFFVHRRAWPSFASQPLQRKLYQAA